MGGISTYLHLKLIEVSKSKPPVASLEIEIRQKKAVKKVTRKIKSGDNLFDLSNELEQYKDGFVVSEIDARTDTITFLNGVVVESGRPDGDVNDLVLRRIQIRETIRAHFEKERSLFFKGVKVLSLFFIDEVAKYRDYSVEDEKGIYAKIFEEEYRLWVQDSKQLLIDEHDGKYWDYIKNIDVSKTHNGYFSVDKKGKLIDTELKGRMNNKYCDDVNAYDLILKDKERLLSIDEPTRFIFSHSALREGWDNPNVFTICTLKHSDNTVTRRQEVGRGLRIAVNHEGKRLDNPDTVHLTNILTIIANESYKSFVSNLQRETIDTLSDRPRLANTEYFNNKTIYVDSAPIIITHEMAEGLEHYLTQNDYIDRYKKITAKYHTAIKEGELPVLPDDLAPYQEQVIHLVNTVFSEDQLPVIENDRSSQINNLNKNNFYKKEFQKLWNRINSKVVYQVDFDTKELVEKAVDAIDNELKVTPIEYIIDSGVQVDKISSDSLRAGEGFDRKKSEKIKETYTVHSQVNYDIIGKIVENVQLTRVTVATVLSKIKPEVFNKFRVNPEEFIINITRLINEQKATTVVEQLTYDSMNEKYGSEIFTDNIEKINTSTAGKKLNKHVYDYAVTDSKAERKFVNDLDISEEVIVYSKLPRGFSIPTPVGKYNPDWAIAFNKNTVRHIYFVAETKGSLSSMQLRKIESTKAKCARKFFHELNKDIDTDSVKYGIVNNYQDLMKAVS